MDFSELSLPQKVAAHELRIKLASPVGSPDYEASLATLLAERART